MTVKTYTRSILLGALVTLSLAGFMIHARIHLIAQNPSFIVPFVAGILSIVVIPALFWFKKTLAYGYVLNGFLCIIGTVTMGHFAIARWFAPFGESSSSEKPCSNWRSSVMTRTGRKPALPTGIRIWDGG